MILCIYLQFVRRPAVFCRPVQSLFEALERVHGRSLTSGLQQESNTYIRRHCYPPSLALRLLAYLVRFVLYAYWRAHSCSVLVSERASLGVCMCGVRLVGCLVPIGRSLSSWPSSFIALRSKGGPSRRSVGWLTCWLAPLSRPHYEPKLRAEIGSSGLRRFSCH